MRLVGSKDAEANTCTTNIKQVSNGSWISRPQAHVIKRRKLSLWLFLRRYRDDQFGCQDIFFPPQNADALLNCHSGLRSENESLFDGYCNKYTNAPKIHGLITGWTNDVAIERIIAVVDTHREATTWIAKSVREKTGHEIGIGAKSNLTNPFFGVIFIVTVPVEKQWTPAVDQQEVWTKRELG